MYEEKKRRNRKGYDSKIKERKCEWRKWRICKKNYKKIRKGGKSGWGRVDGWGKWSLRLRKGIYIKINRGDEGWGSENWNEERKGRNNRNEESDGRRRDGRWKKGKKVKNERKGEKKERKKRRGNWSDDGRRKDKRNSGWRS